MATILIEKYSELVLGFSNLRGQALIDHLILINRGRPQTAQWKYTDWIRLARLVLREHRPKTAMYFDPFHPEVDDITKEVDLPYAARQVGPTPPKRGSRRLAPLPVTTLLDEATTFVDAASKDLNDAKRALNGMKAGHPNSSPNASGAA